MVEKYPQNTIESLFLAIFVRIITTVQQVSYKCSQQTQCKHNRIIISQCIHLLIICIFCIKPDLEERTVQRGATISIFYQGKPDVTATFATSLVTCVACPGGSTTATLPSFTTPTLPSLAWSVLETYHTVTNANHVLLHHFLNKAIYVELLRGRPVKAFFKNDPI